MNKGDNQARHHAASKDTPALEWLLGIIGALLLLFAIAYLIQQELQGEEQLGSVVVTTKAINAIGDGFVVTFSAHNTGSATLADLHMKATLLDGTKEVETAELTIDYLPAHSRRRAGFYLRNDPQRYRLELVPQGFQEP